MLPIITERCEVWVDPHDDPGVLCRQPAVARVRPERRAEYRVCEVHAREHAGYDEHIVSLASDDVHWEAS